MAYAKDMCISSSSLGEGMAASGQGEARGDEFNPFAQMCISSSSLGEGMAASGQGESVQYPAVQAHHQASSSSSAGKLEAARELRHAAAQLIARAEALEAQAQAIMPIEAFFVLSCFWMLLYFLMFSCVVHLILCCVMLKKKESCFLCFCLPQTIRTLQLQVFLLIAGKMCRCSRNQNHLA